MRRVRLLEEVGESSLLAQLPRAARSPLRLAASLGLLYALTGCSDPTPGLSAEEFYARADAAAREVWGEGPNGWSAFAEALNHFDVIQQEINGPYQDQEDLSPDEWPSMQIDAIIFGQYPRPGLDNGLKLLAACEHADLYPELDAALAPPVLLQPWDPSRPVYEVFNDGLSAAGKSRSLSKLLRADARVAAHAADTERVLADFNRQASIARVLSGRRLSIDYLMGVASLTMSMQDARHLALEEKLSADAIRGLLDLFGEKPTYLPPAAAVIDAERDFALATFVDSAAEQGVRANRNKWLDAIETGHAWAAKQAADPTRGPVKEIGDEEFFLSVLDGSSGEEELIGLLRHGFAMVLDNERRLRFDLAGTRATLLVALHKAEHGVYPDSLDEAGVPPDPIAGRPFVYAMTPEKPARPFLIYSVGIDGIDDGGVEKQGGMLEAPSPDQVGYDCVITKARRPYVGFDDVLGGDD